MEEAKIKVFGIGFQKTGTTTLDYALRKFNYRPIGYMPELLPDLKNGNTEKLKEIIEKADLFQDNPWPVLYKKLDELYPNSKFILTLRDADKWYLSMLKHFGGEETEMRKWIYGFGSPLNNEKDYKSVYNNHNKTVIDYFKNRPNDFLIVNWENGAGWKEICEFLNLPIPSEPFPHINKKEHRMFLRKFILRIENKLNSIIRN